MRKKLSQISPLIEGLYGTMPPERRCNLCQPLQRKGLTMGLIDCPECKHGVSEQARTHACPNCLHPFDLEEWKRNSTRKKTKEVFEDIGSADKDCRKENG